MSNNNALNGAKARIVTLNKTIEAIEKENTLLRHRNVVADSRYDALRQHHHEVIDERDVAQIKANKLTAENKALRTKVEKAYTLVACLGILLVVTIGAVTGGFLA